MLRRELQGIYDAEDFVEVTASAHWITELQFNLLVRPNDKNRTYRSVVSRSAAGAAVPAFGRQHVIQLCDLQLRIPNHRVVHLVALRFLNVLRPSAVIRNRVHAQTDDLAISLCEFRLQACHVAEFRRANWSEVLGMRKQYRPAIADPLMEVERALRRFRREIGSRIVNPKVPGRSLRGSAQNSSGTHNSSSILQYKEVVCLDHARFSDGIGAKRKPTLDSPGGFRKTFALPTLRR